MEKIDRLRDGAWLERLYNKIDTLIIGYNETREDCKEIMKRLDKKDEGIREMVKRIKHDLYGGE